MLASAASFRKDWGCLCRYCLRRAADQRNYTLLPQTTRDAYEAQQKCAAQTDGDTSSDSADETALLLG